MPGVHKMHPSSRAGDQNKLSLDQQFSMTLIKHWSQEDGSNSPLLFVLVCVQGERGDHGPPGKGERGEIGPFGPKVSNSRACVHK